MSQRKCGFVSIVGRPNVGKSTLLNQLVGTKIAGVSPKPQTTRGTAQGIVTRPEGQIIFLDTPGLHKPKDKLGHWMIQEIEKAMEGADLLYWLVLPGAIDTGDLAILETLKKKELPIILLVNQVDRFPKPEILPVLDFYHKEFAFADMIPVSAKLGTQMGVLLTKTFELLPEGDLVFPEDQISDQTERAIVSELIREKIYHFTTEEIPYGTTVTVDKFEERPDGIVEIHASFTVERESQKGIVIGKQGQMMKQIGQAAREDVEKFLEKKVFLKLWVQVVPDWKSSTGSLRKLGYE